MQISLIIAILLLLSSVASGRVPLNWREAKLMVFCTGALSIFRLQWRGALTSLNNSSQKGD